MNASGNSVVLHLGDIATLLSRLKEASKRGFVVAKPVPTYGQAAYRGTGDLVPSTWNVIIYRPKRLRPGWQSVVCVDFEVLRYLWRQDYDRLKPSGKVAISIDDAGWGFPLLGVLVGASEGVAFRYREVPVRFFRCDHWEENYWQESCQLAYASQGRLLIRRFGATKETHRIEICTGYINQLLRDQLRKDGWEVRVAKIEGVLQDRLEKQFARYVKQKLGVSLYYDPKETETWRIADCYREAVEYGIRHCPKLLKTGWKALSKHRRSRRFD